MKIQFVITRGETYGGAQRHVIEMASALQRDGHRVQVICGAGAVVPERLKALEVDVVSLPSWTRSLLNPLGDLLAYRGIKKAIQGFRPDLLSTHSSKAGILGRLAAYHCSVPVIFTAHGWPFSSQALPWARPVWRFLERRAARWSARIISVSEEGRQLALAAGLPAEKLITIHNCRPDVASELRAQHQERHPVTINMIGRMDHPKDHPTLLEAVAAIEDCRLEIVGDGSLQGDLEAQAQRLGIAHRVAFLGLLEDVAEPLARADLFCLASKAEGFPRSTLEAMRAGLPVVVSDVGGSAEAVEDGMTGFVVPPRDVEALRKALAKLVTDPDLRSRMGAAGRRLYEEKFTFERMLEATVSVYRQVLKEREQEKEKEKEKEKAP